VSTSTHSGAIGSFAFGVVATGVRSLSALDVTPETTQGLTVVPGGMLTAIVLAVSTMLVKRLKDDSVGGLRRLCVLRSLPPDRLSVLPMV